MLNPDNTVIMKNNKQVPDSAIKKQAWFQSLYQCDKIIYLPVFLLNVKGDTEVALKRLEGSALRYRR
jgi:hypothetical protein